MTTISITVLKSVLPARDDGRPVPQLCDSGRRFALGERTAGRQVAAIVLAALCTLAVQICRQQRRRDDLCGLSAHPQVRFSLDGPSVTVCPLALDSRAPSRIAITSRARWAVMAGGRPLDIASARSS